MDKTETTINICCNCSLITINGSNINLKKITNAANLAEEAKSTVIELGEPS